MFLEKKLTLLAPRKWDDPFENFLSKIPAKVTGVSGLVSLGGIFKKVITQCQFSGIADFEPHLHAMSYANHRASGCETIIVRLHNRWIGIR